MIVSSIMNIAKKNSFVKKNRKEIKNMTDEEKAAIAREERNRYLREWRAKNPDKVRASNERYWVKRVEKLAAEREG
jgi:predicted TIM-barrel fold metal-dependent hydrolase